MAAHILAGMCCMLCRMPTPVKRCLPPACLPTAPRALPASPCLLLPQPDKVSAGDGILSPLDIPIPGAEPGKKDDYYYHDR